MAESKTPAIDALESCIGPADDPGLYGIRLGIVMDAVAEARRLADELAAEKIGRERERRSADERIRLAADREEARARIEVLETLLRNLCAEHFRGDCEMSYDGGPCGDVDACWICWIHQVLGLEPPQAEKRGEES